METPRQRYLARRALKGPWQVTGIKRTNYAGAVVIPACDEENWLWQTLAGLAANLEEFLYDVIVLVVVNQPVAADRRIKIANRRTLEQFTASPLRHKLQIGWVDACSDGFELADGGVGSARKLGFDLALGHLRDDIDPLLVSLDADTLVEANYLEAIFEHFRRSRAGGAVLPYAHQAAENTDVQRAIDTYELYLRLYCCGLARAGSPYAFHTIGSAFACRASAYVACGGMNRRRGGEDFYFLQSLAKTTGIEPVAGTTVHPSARLSTRVPFGTGPALIRLAEEPQERLFYPLEAFDLVGRWLRQVANTLALDGTTQQTAAAALDNDLGAFLHRRKFSRVWNLLQQNHRDRDRLLRAFHGWFDALRTQQLLKQLARSPRRPLLTAEDAVAAFFPSMGLTVERSLAANLERLRQQQNSALNAGK